jgi:hypothetical protein
MPNYLRNVDDTISDPDLIAARSRAGRSAFFEVALVLAEQADNVKANTGASSQAASTTNAGTEGTVFPGGDGGDYGGLCFSGDTLVLMADGSSRPIRETVLYADFVAVPNENGRLEKGRIILRTETMFKAWVKITFEDGRVVEVQPNHRYRSHAGAWEFAVGLEESFHLDEHNKWITCAVVEIEPVTGDLDFYNIGVDHPAHAYVAAGDWVSNRKPSPFEGYATY